MQECPTVRRSDSPVSLEKIHDYNVKHSIHFIFNVGITIFKIRVKKVHFAQKNSLHFFQTFFTVSFSVRAPTFSSNYVIVFALAQFFWYQIHPFTWSRSLWPIASSSSISRRRKIEFSNITSAWKSHLNPMTTVMVNMQYIIANQFIQIDI